MTSRLKNKFLKLILSTEDFAKYLGVKIGSYCTITTYQWGSEPFLIELGNHVHITRNVQFVTHDGGVWVDREKTPDFDVFGKIVIKDNTYIGNNCLILPGVTIGRNCVVGANSVVTKSIPDNTVCAGNPVRFITTTDDYTNRMRKINARTKQLSILDRNNKIKSLQENNLIIKSLLKRQ